MERARRFLTILALPKGKDSTRVYNALIKHVTTLPDVMKGTLTWDQGSQMARHAALTMATDMPVYFTDPHSPWQPGSNENTNGLIREYLPKSTPIPQHQPNLTAITEELNEHPRATLDYLTPREPSNTSSLLPPLDTKVKANRCGGAPEASADLAAPRGRGWPPLLRAPQSRRRPASRQRRRLRHRWRLPPAPPRGLRPSAAPS